jgi:general secretion pathway protein I
MKRRGFTLLEVMISLAILAVALVAISDVNGGAVQMHYYARRSTHATLLLRSKMLDLEEQLHKDGFHDFDDEKHGTFEEDGAPEYAWKAEILKPDIQLDENAMMGMLGIGPGASSSKSTSSTSASASGGGLGQSLANAAAGIKGMGLTSGQLTGGAGMAAMGGPLSGIISGQAKTFIETLKKSVREVRLTVTWKDGANERNISASQQIVILPESVGRAGNANAPPVQPQGPAPGAPQLLPQQTRPRVSGDGDTF